MMWNYDQWWQFGMGYGFHWIFMIAFWALVIWALIALVRGLGAGKGGEGKETAQEILEKRFAKGELSEAEFKKMTNALTKAAR